MIRQVVIRERRLLEYPLCCKGMASNQDDENRSEYVCEVKWHKTVPSQEAKWEKKAGLYTTTHVRASLENQTETLRFVQAAFDLDDTIWELAGRREGRLSNG